MDKLRDGMTLPQVAIALQLSEKTLRRWTQDEAFVGARGAYKDGGRWCFDKQKLKAWIIAVMALSGKDVQSNPPRDSALKMFGIKDGHSVKQ